MYFSRVRIAPEGLNRQEFFNLLSGSAYTHHKLLWKLFSDHDKRVFLFRQELEEKAVSLDRRPRGLPIFYVLSRAEPLPVPGLLNCETKRFEPSLQKGQKLAFSLRANPVVAKRRPEKKNSSHHDVLMNAKATAKEQGIGDQRRISEAMDEAARSWLHDRSKKCGFSLSVIPEVHGYNQHVQRRKGRTIRFSSVDYQGILEVTEPDSFKETLFNGLGRSRAFGCGLMLVRRC